MGPAFPAPGPAFKLGPRPVSATKPPRTRVMARPAPRGRFPLQQEEGSSLPPRALPSLGQHHPQGLRAGQTPFPTGNRDRLWPQTLVPCCHPPWPQFPLQKLRGTGDDRARCPEGSGQCSPCPEPSSTPRPASTAPLAAGLPPHAPLPTALGPDAHGSTQQKHRPQAGAGRRAGCSCGPRLALHGHLQMPGSAPQACSCPSPL